MTERSYNYSAIQAAYVCLKKFKLVYVDKIQPPVPMSADLTFGTAIHLGIESCLEGGDGVEVFNAFWNAEKAQERRYGRNNWEDLQSQGEVLLSRFARLHKKKYKPFKMEERLFSSLEDVRLEGTPDFVGEYDGTPSVVDFKTAAYPYTEEKLICNEQMPLYAYMAEKEWGYKAEQYVYCVLVKGKEPRIQVLTCPIDKEAQRRTLDNIVAVCRELDKRTQFHENRGSCLIGQNRCDFWDVCHGKK